MRGLPALGRRLNIGLRDAAAVDGNPRVLAHEETEMSDALRGRGATFVVEAGKGSSK